MPGGVAAGVGQYNSAVAKDVKANIIRELDVLKVTGALIVVIAISALTLVMPPGHFQFGFADNEGGIWELGHIKCVVDTHMRHDNVTDIIGSIAQLGQDCD